MTITVKIDPKAYIKLVYALSYRKPSMIIMLCSGVLMLAFSILSFSGGLYSEDFPVVPLIISITILIIIPISIYFTSKKNYNSLKILNELVSYEFIDQRIKITGDDFTADFNLNNAYKILETNHWFLIYQTKMAANLIPKSNLSDEEIWKLRSIFVHLKNVKNKLKYK